jgi:hypothetical protein
MGGPGSGSHYHWWRPAKKTTVEHCLSLDANRWAREGILKAGVRQAGSWRWTYRDGSGFSVQYEVDTLDPSRPHVRLSYSWVWTATRQQDSAAYRVPLTTTRPRFGGLRWWFVCPLVVNGRFCGGRVVKLYLPPGERLFGCRHCHDLTYQSAQQHDKRADLLRRHPELIQAMLDRSPNVTMLVLALKALNPRLL